MCHTTAEDTEMGATHTSAIDVAKYLVLLACSEDEPDCLTLMRAQKLLYYAQGWSLVHRKRPLFWEQIEAWAHGPVVPSVYQEFKDCGRSAIDPDRGSADNLTDEEREFVSEIWSTYRPYSAISLSDMTHEEPPWKDARGNIPREAPSSREITHQAMRDFFTSLLPK